MLISERRNVIFVRAVSRSWTIWSGLQTKFWTKPSSTSTIFYTITQSAITYIILYNMSHVKYKISMYYRHMVYHHRGLRVCTAHNRLGHERHIYWKFIYSVFILLKYRSLYWKKTNLNLAPISIKAKLNINIDANFVIFEFCCCLSGKFVRSSDMSRLNYGIFWMKLEFAYVVEL